MRLCVDEPFLSEVESMRGFGSADGEFGVVDLSRCMLSFFALAMFASSSLVSSVFGRSDF